MTKFKEIVQKLKEHKEGRLRIDIFDCKSCLVSPKNEGNNTEFVTKAYPKLEIVGGEKAKQLLKEISDMLDSLEISNELVGTSDNLFIMDAEPFEISNQVLLKISGGVKDKKEIEEGNKKIRELIEEINNWIK